MTGILRVIRAADCRTMPWKNGGGSTTEITIAPEGAGFDDFDWRVSMATVSTDGPFSIFPGIDRTLSVLDGTGITLRLEGRPPITLTPETPPFAFPGDIPTSAELLAGTITDLNVMTRHGRFQHRVSRHVLIEPASVTVEGPLTLVFCRMGEIAGSGVRLAAGDSVLVSGAVAFDTSGPTIVFVMTLVGEGGGARDVRTPMASERACRDVP